MNSHYSEMTETSVDQDTKEQKSNSLHQQGDDLPSIKDASIDSRSCKKRATSPKLSLDLSQTTGPSVHVGSPESDGDILGILDHSPEVCEDVYDASTLMPKFNPYSRVFENIVFSELMPHVFLRDQPVVLRVVDMNILPSALNIFNQIVFTIILHHGSTHWTITKKSRQISSLHGQLKSFKRMLKLPAATSEARNRRHSLREQIRGRSFQTDTPNFPSHRLVKFPRKSLQRIDRYSQADVELYLGNLLHHSLLRSHCAVLEFFEISPLSFVRHLGPKMKEGYVKKRSGERNALSCCGGPYKRRWLVLKETCIFCISPGGGTPRTVMLMDSTFQVSHGFRHTRIRKGLLITNLNRSLVLKCDGEETAQEWTTAIEHARNTYASDFCQTNRHHSFAPVRKKSLARWYVDASWYMSDVADLMESAQDEIFITDWWLSPDIYMKRPDLTGKQWKLNEILKRQAARGVKVFILLYKEVELALGLNSLYTKQNLCQMSPNIRVLRHPDHFKGSLYWAHHEKMVIIDQMQAFIGGIDLCYGRWDDYRHKLVDVGHGGLLLKPQYSSLGQLIQNTHNIFAKGKSNHSDDESDNIETETTETEPQVTSEEPGLCDHEEHKLAKNKKETNPTEMQACNILAHDMLSRHEILSIRKSSISADNSSLFVQGSSQSTSNDITVKLSNENVPDQILTNMPPMLPVNNIVHEEIILKQPPLNTLEGMATHPTNLSPPLASSEGEDSIESSRGTTSRSSIPNENSEEVLTSDNESNHSQTGFDQPNTHEILEGQHEKTELCPNNRKKQHRGKIPRNFKAVKNLGIDLVVEMKEKKKEMKQWTGKKVPGFKRTRSLDSEIGLSTCSEEESEEEDGRFSRKSRKLRRKIKQRLKPKQRSIKLTRACSLIELYKELPHQDVSSIHMWVGKDYVNWITKDLHDPHIPFSDSVNRLQTPRMPWHDIAMYVEGAAARDAARHFIERWNAVKSKKMKNNDRYQYLIPKTYKPSSFSPSQLEPKHRVKCQVLRSLGAWSGGISVTERSIYNAYLDAIKGSKHFIYIENQFFITSASINRSEVANSIAYQIAQRVIKADRNGQTFRVYIVLPLLPAFEGQIGTPSGVAMQYILHYTYESLVSGPNSLIGVLKEAKIDWQNYISICSLRTYDVLEGQLVSELIYIHSKLMIVDDRLVIAGSANINDRSLLGSRDSEVALVIEDEEFCKGRMNGKNYQRGDFAGSLRIYLFSEHLGRMGKEYSFDALDPISEEFFGAWQSIAAKNTKIYDDVFSVIPSDSVGTFTQLEQRRTKVHLAKSFPEKAKIMLRKVKGRLVLFPLEFLKDETLKPGPTNKEFLLPVEMWV